MPAKDFSAITIGGPCKITDGAAVFYTEGPATLTPKLTHREIPSAVAGTGDKVLVDLTWELDFTPKSVYNSTLRGVLVPTAYTNFVTSGARIIGAANRAVSVIGADGNGYDLTRAKITGLPEMYLGLGKSLWGAVKYTGFIGQGKALTDADAVMVANTTAWSQADFPTGHQEAECALALGALTGWSTVFAEEGFALSHELSLAPVKQGNITVDQKIIGYRGMLSCRTRFSFFSLIKPIRLQRVC